MPELRQNFATKEWVIIATERAKRPQEMVRQHPPRTHSSFSPKCPFCPGNQATTPPGGDACSGHPQRSLDSLSRAQQARRFQS
jgi:galactose-1-phosphate uridylyltransferase